MLQIRYYNFLNGNLKFIKRTPLHLTLQNHHSFIYKLLLNAGAKISLKDKLEQTPLHFAVRFGNKQIVEDLLEAGANPDDLNSKKVINKSNIHLFFLLQNMVSQILFNFQQKMEENQ